MDTRVSRYFLYSIRDKIAGEFGPPFVAKNDGVAMRMFARTLQEATEKGDFDLYRVGVFFSDSDVDDYVVTGNVSEKVVRMTEVEE